MRPPDELVALFRSRGLKITPQRQAIFRALGRLDGQHPGADVVYDAVARELPSISLKTVYQTLHDLASLGELVQLDVGTGSFRFDTELGPHHHLVCERCGRIRDVNVDLTGLVPAPGDARGFRVVTTEVVFRGVCDACAAQPAEADLGASTAAR